MTKFPPFLRLLFLVAFIASFLFIGLSDDDPVFVPPTDAGVPQQSINPDVSQPTIKDNSQKNYNETNNSASEDDVEVASLMDDADIITIDRDTETSLSSDAIDVSNNIVNAILDTLSAEITDIDIRSSESGSELTVNLQWQSNLDTLENDLRQAFAFRKSTRVHKDGFHHALYSVSEPKKSEANHEIFQALLENKISLVVKAGEHEKLITIATGLRNQAGVLEYIMLPSKSDSRSSLIIEKETTPIVIDDIPLHEAKLLQEVALGIALERLDTGLTFNILLDKKEL